jgi:phenylalanyl-tRNA synthetase beta chain
MNVSYRWLQALAPGIQGSAEEVAHRLALLGAPVDELTHLGAGIGDVVVARVEEVWQHPNADRLRVTRVNAGGESTVQVVCGAPNVEAGRLYPFAPVGASLPGGLNIGRAKLRGETSEGMLCSARELGLGRDHGGLMTLNGDFAPGTRLVEALGLDDWRLLIDVTPNRAEMLSHVGVARELAPGGDEGVELPGFPGARRVRMSTRAGRLRCELAGIDVAIEDEAGCPRYMGAVVRGVRVGPSPEWLATRLRAIGLRPINNIVDATNYVLHELGQPLHAFDLAKLRGARVRIRRAAEGESLITLDGNERALLPTDLVIADGEGSVAIAGVMGGANSEVDEGTTDLFLECALFEPKTVRRTRGRLVLSTDASYRFERGVDPEGQPEALERLVDLIVAVAGGEAVEGVDLNPHPWERRAVALRPERVKRVLGTGVQPAEIRTLLEEIGFEVNVSAWPIRVLVPGFRPDVEEEIDLIEEIARRRGYDSFPDELAPFRPSTVPESPEVEVERRIAARFVGWGFLEARTTGFAPESAGEVRVLNPLSAEEAFMRSSLTPGLLRRVEHNFAHGVRDVRLFEVGTVFHAGEAGGVPREERRVAAAFAGARAPRHWTGEAGNFEVWDLKGMLEELAREYPEARVEVAGAAFTVSGPEGSVGGGGLAAAVDAPAWAAPVWTLELRLPAAAVDRRSTRYAPLPTQPASERDLALLTPHGVAAAQVGATIADAAGALLEGFAPFDLYEGKGLPEGTRSVAWRLRFRAADRTLTDAEVDAAVDAVLRALEERHGVRRR